MTSKKSTSSRADSPANLFRLRVDGKLRPIRVGSGRSSYASCLKYDPASYSWRTYPDSSIEGWPASSVIFPRAGTMRDGVAYRRPMWELPTSDRESSSSGPNSQGLWPTPVGDGDRKTTFKQGGMPLGVAVRMWPTPTSRDHKDGSAELYKNVPVNSLLGRAVHWPTPSVSDTTGVCPPEHHGKHGAPHLKDQVNGQLNPTFVCWLMGFPKGWTEVD